MEYSCGLATRLARQDPARRRTSAMPALLKHLRKLPALCFCASHDDEAATDPTRCSPRAAAEDYRPDGAAAALHHRGLLRANNRVLPEPGGVGLLPASLPASTAAGDSPGPSITASTNLSGEALRDLHGFQVGLHTYILNLHPTLLNSPAPINSHVPPSQHCA